MTDHSDLVVFFLMLPLVIQIIIPLLMLMGFGLLCVVRAVFGRLKVVDGAKDYVEILEELQFSRS